MKIVTNFLLRKNRKADDAKSSVCVKITYLGNRIELVTGIYSSTDHWDVVRQRIKDKVIGARVDNERLDRIKKKRNTGIDNKFPDAFDVFIKKDFNNVRNTAWDYLKSKGSCGTAA